MKRNFWPLLGLGICVGTAICTCLALAAIWSWLVPKSGGWTPQRPPNECRLLKGDVLVHIRPYAEAKLFCGFLGHSTPACGSVGADPKTGRPWVMFTPPDDPKAPWSPADWAFVFEHEALRDGCVTCHQVHGSVNDKMLLQRDNNLCLRCHAQVNFPTIGKSSHATRLPQGACFSAGCHTAIHGSNFDDHLRY